MDYSMPGSSVFHCLLESAQIHVSIKWCYLTILSSLPPSPLTFSLSQHQALFKWVSSSHQVAKYLSFSSSISPSNKYSEVFSFRIDWFHLLAIQRILKSLLQLHNSKASFLQYSAFFMVLLSHLYVTTGKIIASTIQTFGSKVMSLFFNILSRLS